MPTTRTPRTKKPADDTGATGVPSAEAPAVPDFTTSKPTEEKRVPLFSIDGDQFTVPETIGPRLFYLGLDRIRDEGVILATMYINQLVLGREQYARLMKHVEAQAITDEQFDQIGGMISDLFYQKGKAALEGKDATTDSAPDSADS